MACKCCAGGPAIRPIQPTKTTIVLMHDSFGLKVDAIRNYRTPHAGFAMIGKRVLTIGPSTKSCSCHDIPQRRQAGDRPVNRNGLGRMIEADSGFLPTGQKGRSDRFRNATGCNAPSTVEGLVRIPARVHVITARIVARSVRHLSNATEFLKNRTFR